MRPWALAAASATIASSAFAGSVDLIDGVFGNPSADVITEIADGVTFTFTSTNNLVGANRWINVGSNDFINGLQVGGGGGSTVEFELTVSQDIILTGYGTNQSGGFALPSQTAPNAAPVPIFDLLDPGNTLIADAFINDPASVNTSNPSGENDVVVTGLSIALLAGTTYTFDINNTGAGVQGFFTSFEFTTAPVPLPAGLALLLTGLGVVGVSARRRAA